MSHLTPEEIEKEIELERAELAINIAQLQDSVSLDRMWERGTDYARAHAREAGEIVLDQVKRNPLPLAMIGAGLAWWAFGGSRKAVTADPAFRARPAYAPVKPRIDTTEAEYRTVPADAAANRLDARTDPEWMTDDDALAAGEPQWVPADDVWAQPGEHK